MVLVWPPQKNMSLRKMKSMNVGKIPGMMSHIVHRNSCSLRPGGTISCKDVVPLSMSAVHLSALKRFPFFPISPSLVQRSRFSSLWYQDIISPSSVAGGIDIYVCIVFRPRWAVFKGCRTQLLWGDSRVEMFKRRPPPPFVQMVFPQ